MKKIMLVLAVLVLVVATACAYNATNITTATTTTIKTGSTFLSHIVVNGGTMGQISVWDNNASGGTVIATIASPLAGQTYVYDAGLALGCKVVTADNTNLTVLWQ